MCIQRCVVMLLKHCELIVFVHVTLPLILMRQYHDLSRKIVKAVTTFCICWVIDVLLVCHRALGVQQVCANTSMCTMDV